MFPIERNIVEPSKRAPKIVSAAFHSMNPLRQAHQ